MSDPTYHEPLGAPREGWSGNLVDGAIERWTGLNQSETKRLVERSLADLDTIHWILAPLRMLRSFFVAKKP